jgi:hypothetical protein
LDGANSVRNIDLLHFGGGMRTYFLQFELWNKDVNKFWFGIIDADLSKDNLPDICRKIIDDKFYPIRPADVEIKVNAFNNIEM